MLTVISLNRDALIRAKETIPFSTIARKDDVFSSVKTVMSSTTRADIFEADENMNFIDDGEDGWVTDLSEEEEEEESTDGEDDDD